MNVRSFIVCGETAVTAKRSTSKKATALKVPMTPPSEPVTKGERTRAVLLNAAKRLFVSKGYHGTSMREIADEAGLALGGSAIISATRKISLGVLMDVIVSVVVCARPAGSDGETWCVTPPGA
jgi:hypothetical protein